MIVVGFTFLITCYCFFIVYLWIGWERIPLDLNEETNLSVSIIIPIRNEAANIKNLLNDIKNQSYENSLEVIIVDDHSEDGSAEIVQSIIANNTNVELIGLIDTYGKKAALTAGVKAANSEIILTTDGDCRVSNTWVQTMIRSFTSSTQFVSGPVRFINDGSYFNCIQSMEFSSLIGSGASLIGWGKPVMANGANMGFRKKAFLAVNGFEGNQDTASGDDVFLLHKIAKTYPDSVAFVKQAGAVVQTQAQPTIKAFIRQRIRWVSKWKAYKDLFTKTTAVLVFLVSLALVVLPILVVLKKISLFVWLNLLIIKLFFDFFFIRQISRFFEKKLNLILFILLQVLYPFYVVFTALFSIQKTYYWKGRQVK